MARPNIFVSGVLKFADWDKALYLAANEYPVTWIDPVTAAVLGLAIELIAPVLLALGLATRFAAAAMLVLALVIQFNYVAFDTHLFWAVLADWFVVWAPVRSRSITLCAGGSPIAHCRSPRRRSKRSSRSASTVRLLSLCGYWLAAFALLALRRGGAISLDELIARVVRRRFPQLKGSPRSLSKVFREL